MKIKDEGLTALQCLEKRDHWLNKGVELEAEKKSESFVNRAVIVSEQWENAALDGRA